MGSRIKVKSKMLVWGFAFVLCFFSTAICQAQTYAEFFRQKKTQEKYLLKQIAYLKLFADQAWKGYKLVSGGLETIKDFTSGEFKLHEAFISALSKVGSLVRKDYRVEEVAKSYLLINSSFGALQKSSASFSQAHRNYFMQVKDGLMEDVNGDMDELLDIVLSGDLEMNDAERLSRLKKIHMSMWEKAGFARWFCTEAQLLAQSQKMEQLDIEELRRLYEKN